jgi:hypothetical protein
LILEGLRFAGRPVSFIRVSFFRDQFHTASIYYKPSLDAKTQELFDNIKTELNGKYFVTNSDYRLFKSPYSDGDGYEMSAVRQGLGTISAYWIFDRPDGYQNVISLKIDEDLYVVLAYQDGCLIKEQIEADKAKNVRDY